MLVTAFAWAIRCDFCLSETPAEPNEEDVEKQFVAAGGNLIAQSIGDPKHLCVACAKNIRETLIK
jgi:hypothetical protein